VNAKILICLRKGEEIERSPPEEVKAAISNMGGGELFLKKRKQSDSPA